MSTLEVWVILIAVAIGIPTLSALWQRYVIASGPNDSFGDAVLGVAASIGFVWLLLSFL